MYDMTIEIYYRLTCSRLRKNYASTIQNSWNFDVDKANPLLRTMTQQDK